jgi:tRNA(adenine34) deaminase
MTPEEMMGAALSAAAAGLAAGEQPIGAVVVLGDEIVGRAYTQEKTRGRRLVHAEARGLDISPGLPIVSR